MGVWLERTEEEKLVEPGCFLFEPTKMFSSNQGENWRENQGLCFGQNCPSQHSDFLNFSDFFFAFFFFFFFGVFFYVIIPFLFPSALIISLVFFFSFLLFSFLLFLFFLFSRVLGFLFLRKKFWVLELIFILFLLNEVPSIHNFLIKIMCYFLFYSLIYRDMMVNLYKLYFVFSFFFFSHPNERVFHLTFPIPPTKHHE